MKNRTLFDTEHDEAVFSMIEMFQEQLRTARSPQEAELIREAIRGWEATLGPALPFNPVPPPANTAATAPKAPGR